MMMSNSPESPLVKSCNEAICLDSIAKKNYRRLPTCAYLLLRGIDDVMNAHLLDVLDFARIVRERVDFCAESLSEQNGVVP